MGAFVLLELCRVMSFDLTTSRRSRLAVIASAAKNIEMLDLGLDRFAD
jgi:hypothetical protein